MGHKRVHSTLSGGGRVNKQKTHCKHGHPYDAKNTWVDNRGRRNCKACSRIKYAKRYAERRAAEKAAGIAPRPKSKPSVHQRVSLGPPRKRLAADLARYGGVSFWTLPELLADRAAFQAEAWRRHPAPITSQDVGVVTVGWPKSGYAS